jgi:hypothetical protein
MLHGSSEPAGELVSGPTTSQMVKEYLSDDQIDALETFIKAVMGVGSYGHQRLHEKLVQQAKDKLKAAFTYVVKL